MTAAPNSPLVERVAVAMWNTWNRVMVEYGLHKKSNGGFYEAEPADDPIKAEAHRLLRRAALEEAQAALAACEAEEMRRLLQRLDDASTGDGRTFEEEELYAIWREARALLARQDGNPTERSV